MLKHIPITYIPAARNLKFFVMVLILEQAYSWLTATLVAAIDPSLVVVPEIWHNKSTIYLFLTTVILIPIIETIIFQFGVIELTTKWKFKPIYSILLSAIIFSLSHWYNIPYVLAMIGTGFIFAYYYVSLRQQGRWNKILLVTLAHAIGNLSAFLSNHVFR